MTTSTETSIITPAAASESGLVPEGWKVIADKVSDPFDLSDLDFSYDAFCRRGSEIDNHSLIERYEGIGAFGGLWFVRLVINEQEQGRDVVPPELKGKANFLLPDTILEAKGGGVVIPGITAPYRKLWHPAFFLLNNRFGSYNRLLRLRTAALSQQ
jgi:hypothetical protein